VVDKNLPKAVAAVLCRRVKQQSRHFSIGGNGQHALAGVSVRDIIADRIFGLLSVVLLGAGLIWLGYSLWSDLARPVAPPEAAVEY